MHLVHEFKKIHICASKIESKWIHTGIWMDSLIVHFELGFGLFPGVNCPTCDSLGTCTWERCDAADVCMLRSPQGKLTAHCSVVSIPLSIFSNPLFISPCMFLQPSKSFWCFFQNFFSLFLGFSSDFSFCFYFFHSIFVLLEFLFHSGNHVYHR